LSKQAKPDGAQRVRLFFGIALPPALLELRFIAEQNLHLTLKFMGWMTSADVEPLLRQLREIAAACPPIQTSARALGAFPTPKRARVLVVELDAGTGQLTQLAERLEAVAEEVGVPRETRPFKAHVTLARLSNPADVRELLAPVSWTQISCTLDRLRLYQSTLLPSGSSYSVLGEALLGPRSPNSS
jgi:2'-5' RNA ligase